MSYTSFDAFHDYLDQAFPELIQEDCTDLWDWIHDNYSESWSLHWYEHDITVKHVQAVKRAAFVVRGVSLG